MIFWIICVGIALVTIAFLGQAFVRPKSTDAETTDYDLRVYRDQLREVDRDLARGVLTQADASRVRTEVSRRILAADTQQKAQGKATGGAPKVAFVAMTLVLLGGSFWLYRDLGAPGYGDLALSDRLAQAEEVRLNRPTQDQAESNLPAPASQPEANEEYLALVQKLRDTVQARPNDLQGHVLLAQNEANLGNFTAAYIAQRGVLRLKGEDTSAADLVDYADMLILAAGGYVSPEAEGALRAVLEMDASNGTARYYMGLMLSQTGRPDITFRIWDELLRVGPREAPWIDPILTQIADTARVAGINYQIPEIGSGNTLGPSLGDIESAGELSGAERIEMIEGMVAGLSDRLATEGGTANEWAQLISSLGVLGRTEQAFAVYSNAIDVFAEDLSAIDLINRAGQRAGVAE